MTPTLEALCRRWMACEDFVWERGMITASGWIVVSVGLDDLVLTRDGYDVRHETQESLSGAEIPDLSHAGTAGWLLEIGVGSSELEASISALERCSGRGR